MKTDIEFIPHGNIWSRFTKGLSGAVHRHRRAFKSQGSTPGASGRICIFVSYSKDLNEEFSELFRREATQDSRLLILNEGSSTDMLMSRIVGLQIRKPERFCVIDADPASGKVHLAPSFVSHLLERLWVGLKADDRQDRILNASAVEGILHVVSANFERLDVPISKITTLARADALEIKNFEIDEDGAFIYWPRLNVHLGWRQLEQIVNPEAARKALQKSHDFNIRYGRAVRKVRQGSGLQPTEIQGLSEKQLQRIEKGECRLTSNATKVLSAAHKLKPSDYMQKLAGALE